MALSHLTPVLMLTVWLGLWAGHAPFAHGSPLGLYRFRRATFYMANETVCVVDGEVFHEGDPIPSDDPCESCKCRPPGFACILRKCEAKPGCKAVRKEGECCPEYVCGCEHNGALYQDGETIRNTESPCYTCKCQGASIACALVDCYFRHDCAPTYAQGECCPRYENCAPEKPYEPYLRNTSRPQHSTARPRPSTITPISSTTKSGSNDHTLNEVKVEPVTEIIQVFTSTSTSYGFKRPGSHVNDVNAHRPYAEEPILYLTDVLGNETIADTPEGGEKVKITSTLPTPPSEEDSVKPTASTPEKVFVENKVEPKIPDIVQETNQPEESVDKLPTTLVEELKVTTQMVEVSSEEFPVTTSVSVNVDIKDENQLETSTAKFYSSGESEAKPLKDDVEKVEQAITTTFKPYTVIVTENVKLSASDLVQSESNTEQIFETTTKVTAADTTLPISESLPTQQFLIDTTAQPQFYADGNTEQESKATVTESNLLKEKETVESTTTAKAVVMSSTEQSVVSSSQKEEISLPETAPEIHASLHIDIQPTEKHVAATTETTTEITEVVKTDEATTIVPESREGDQLLVEESPHPAEEQKESVPLTEHTPIAQTLFDMITVKERDPEKETSTEQIVFYTTVSDNVEETFKSNVEIISKNYNEDGAETTTYESTVKDGPKPIESEEKESTVKEVVKPIESVENESIVKEVIKPIEFVKSESTVKEVPKSIESVEKESVKLPVDNIEIKSTSEKPISSTEEVMATIDDVSEKDYIQDEPVGENSDTSESVETNKLLKSTDSKDTPSEITNQNLETKGPYEIEILSKPKIESPLPEIVHTNTSELPPSSTYSKEPPTVQPEEPIIHIESGTESVKVNFPTTINSLQEVTSPPGEILIEDKSEKEKAPLNNLPVESNPANKEDSKLPKTEELYIETKSEQNELKKDLDSYIESLPIEAVTVPKVEPTVEPKLTETADESSKATILDLVATTEVSLIHTKPDFEEPVTDPSRIIFYNDNPSTLEEVGEKVIETKGDIGTEYPNVLKSTVSPFEVSVSEADVKPDLSEADVKPDFSEADVKPDLSKADVKPEFLEASITTTPEEFLIATTQSEHILVDVTTEEHLPKIQGKIPGEFDFESQQSSIKLKTEEYVQKDVAEKPVDSLVSQQKNNSLKVNNSEKTDGDVILSVSVKTEVNSIVATTSVPEVDSKKTESIVEVDKASTDKPDEGKQDNSSGSEDTKDQSEITNSNVSEIKSDELQNEMIINELRLAKPSNFAPIPLLYSESFPGMQIFRIQPRRDHILIKFSESTVTKDFPSETKHHETDKVDESSPNTEIPVEQEKKVYESSSVPPQDLKIEEGKTDAPVIPEDNLQKNVTKESPTTGADKEILEESSQVKYVDTLAVAESIQLKNPITDLPPDDVGKVSSSKPSSINHEDSNKSTVDFITSTESSEPEYTTLSQDINISEIVPSSGLKAAISSLSEAVSEADKLISSTERTLYTTTNHGFPETTKIEVVVTDLPPDSSEKIEYKPNVDKDIELKDALADIPKKLELGDNQGKTEDDKKVIVLSDTTKAQVIHFRTSELDTPLGKVTTKDSDTSSSTVISDKDESFSSTEAQKEISSESSSTTEANIEVLNEPSESTDVHKKETGESSESTVALKEVLSASSVSPGPQEAGLSESFSSTEAHEQVKSESSESKEVHEVVSSKSEVLLKEVSGEDSESSESHKEELSKSSESTEINKDLFIKSTEAHKDVPSESSEVQKESSSETSESTEPLKVSTEAHRVISSESPVVQKEALSETSESTEASKEVSKESTEAHKVVSKESPEEKSSESSSSTEAHKDDSNDDSISVEATTIWQRISSVLSDLTTPLTIDS